MNAAKFNPLHPVKCVYWKHGAYWLVKRGRWERIGSTLEEALAEYARREAVTKDGKLPTLIETTLARHCRGLSANTRTQYRIAADVLKRKLAAFDRPDQIKSRHVAKIKADGVAHPNMANRVVSLLRTLFGYWVEEQLCDANPCVGVARHMEPKRKRYITDDEWTAIYKKAPKRLQVIMRVQYLTGQRINDVLGIKRNQITEAGLEFAQQKTGARLLVRWSPDLRLAVDDALALHGGVKHMTLFLGRDGGRPDYRSVLEQWHRVRIAAGVADAKPNDLRAKAATDARRQGKDATALLGHKNKSMTDRYLRDRQTPEVEGPSFNQEAR